MNSSFCIKTVLITITISFILTVNMAYADSGAPGCEGIENGQVIIDGQIIRWENAADDDIEKLKAWCRAVGPPLYIQQNNKREESPKVDELVVVSWNVKVGGGDLDSFIKDLREGKLTDGTAVDHFVILLQEVHRGGPDVPSVAAGKIKTGRSIRTVRKGTPRRDIAEIARKYSLHLFYVPAMRNGWMSDDLPAEDRGSAVLSSLPLMSPVVVELPLERQRRLAMSGKMSFYTSSGNLLSLRIVNLHLENRAKWLRFFRSFGAARLNQVKAFTSILPYADYLIVAGDFNTWFSGPDEAVIRYLDKYMNRADVHAKAFQEDEESRASRSNLDYIFYRMPERWMMQYRRINDRYGSDHNPVLLKAVLKRK